MIIRFPQELVDEIIDYLGEDSDALKACSLVCQAWVSRCRSHLFETCTLTRVVALEMAFYLDPLRIEMQTRFNAGFFAILPHITLLILHSRNPLTLRVPLIDI
jgi:hypothetical protein